MITIPNDVIGAVKLKNGIVFTDGEREIRLLFPEITELLWAEAMALFREFDREGINKA